MVLNPYCDFFHHPSIILEPVSYYPISGIPLEPVTSPYIPFEQEPTGLRFRLPEWKQPDINLLSGFCRTGTGCLEEAILGFRKLPESSYNYVVLGFYKQ